MGTYLVVVVGMRSVVSDSKMVASSKSAGTGITPVWRNNAIYVRMHVCMHVCTYVCTLTSSGNTCLVIAVITVVALEAMQT